MQTPTSRVHAALAAVLLLIDTISRTDRFYTAAYLHELELHSPFRFSFLKEQRDRFLKRHDSLMKWLETALLFQSHHDH